MIYETLKVRTQDSICFVQIDRLVAECHDVLNVCEESATVVVLSGHPEVFFFGADFKASAAASGTVQEQDAAPGSLRDLLLRLAKGPFETFAHVRGNANAGSVGFVAASYAANLQATGRYVQHGIFSKEKTS